jgi:hypothetical protein
VRYALTSIGDWSLWITLDRKLLPCHTVFRSTLGLILTRINSSTPGPLTEPGVLFIGLVSSRETPVGGLGGVVHGVQS